MGSMTTSNEYGQTRVATSYEFGNDAVSISILIPTENQTLLEAQALATEKAADHLAGLAHSIRLQLPK